MVGHAVQNYDSEEKVMKKGTVAILSSLMGVATGVAIGAGLALKGTDDSNNKIKEMSEKHLALFLLMNQWVKVKQGNKSLASYFDKNGYKKIAIYGMSYVGESLIRELRGSSVEVAYGIDKNADGIYADIEVFSAEDELPQVDAIIVTSITFYEEIQEILLQKISCPIISLEDVLYEI